MRNRLIIIGIYTFVAIVGALTSVYVDRKREEQIRRRRVMEELIDQLQKENAQLRFQLEISHESADKEAELLMNEAARQYERRTQLESLVYRL